MEHPIENIMHSTMAQLRDMVDVNTVVGDPIVAEGETVILPVSKVCLGFVSGGGEYNLSGGGAIKKAGEAIAPPEGRYPFAGTAVAGMSLTPLAFLSVRDGNVRVLPAQHKDGMERLADMVPEALSMIERVCTKKNDPCDRDDGCTGQ